MAYLIGILIGSAVTALPALTGIGRGRDFYPIAMFVIAAYYVLFAAMSGSAAVLVAECAVAAVFIVLAVIGFRTRLWLVAAAITGHGLFDAVHHLFINNPGMPPWWPGFCMSADLVIGGILALRIATQQRTSHAHQEPVKTAATIRK